MAHKIMKELRDLSKDELVARARKVESEIFQNRMKIATGQLENVASVWKMRKELARVKTLLTRLSQKSA